MIKRMIGIVTVVAFIVACGEKASTPRPRAYPLVEYPERAYTTYDTTACPITFRYPSYGEIKYKKENCWFDIYMPVFNARLHCSYVPLQNKAEHAELVRDAFVIAGKINEKANYMEESRIRNPQGVNGLLLNWTGPAASPVHFFLSDSTNHFFKAALYFDSRVQPDSLAPMVTFIKQDIDSLIASFNWKG
jgi:gliding motility-associated lipoprotein GldD